MSLVLNNWALAFKKKNAFVSIKLCLNGFLFLSATVSGIYVHLLFLNETNKTVLFSGKTILNVMYFLPPDLAQ